jgi:hypothetical protein
MSAGAVEALGKTLRAHPLPGWMRGSSRQTSSASRRRPCSRSRAPSECRTGIIQPQGSSYRRASSRRTDSRRRANAWGYWPRRYSSSPCAMGRPTASTVFAGLFPMSLLSGTTSYACLNRPNSVRASLTRPSAAKATVRPARSLALSLFSPYVLRQGVRHCLSASWTISTPLRDFSGACPERTPRSGRSRAILLSHRSSYTMRFKRDESIS